MKSLLTSLLFLLAVSWVGAQNCNVTVNLNPEVNLCAPGSTVFIPVITGNYLDFNWSPATNLSNPDQLITTANVDTTTTYALNINSLSATNLLFNGDFSQGDTGFYSDYIYGTGGGVGLLSNEGQYAIATNAGSTHNQFANCSDHTGGGGMMVVNASGDASNIWCQDIEVNPGSNYHFSAWVTSVVSQNPAQLQFSVNGTLLGSPFNAIPNTCNWRQFSADWSANGVSSATICIANTNFTPAGNDFALDDISFREICTTTASVTVNVTQLEADFAVPTTLCASNLPISPNTFFSSTTTPGGSWQLDGQPVVTFNPATLAPGSHTLVYNVANNNCSTSASASFNLSEPPFAGVPDYFVRCFNAAEGVAINLSDVIQNEDLNGSWQYVSGPTGSSINASTGALTSMVPGEFQYRYTVSGNGICPDASTVQRFDLYLNPLADLPATETLDCTVPELTLSGANTSTGNNIVYSWFRDNIQLIDQFTRTLFINRGGTYVLEVRDENNNCTARDTTEVVALIDNLSLELGYQAPPCNNINGGSIQINTIQGGTPPFLVSLDGQNFLNTDQFINLGPGNYTVQVQDAGGCEAAASVDLPAPAAPEILLQTTQVGPLTLGGSASITVSSNPPLGLLDTFFWSPILDDNDRVGEKQWIVQPLETTNYQLTVRDANGCETQASILLTVRPEGAVFIPNAISPNEDGSNDRFVFFDQGAIANISSLTVFDRWGAQVYQANNLQANSSEEAWDGTFKGDLLPSGVYIYAAEVEWINGEKSFFQGDISIVR